MTYKAYLDNINAKTGMTPDDFMVIAKKKGLLEPGVKVGAIVSWLKDDYGLGQGHAMAIVLALKQADAPKQSADEKIDRFFSHGKSSWRDAYDLLIKKVEKFGKDVRLSPTDTYISLLKGNKKFAVIGITADQFDIGIKLKGVEPKDRFEAAGTWNSMVTHRVRISKPDQIDQEVLSWLRQSYDAA